MQTLPIESFAYYWTPVSLMIIKRECTQLEAFISTAFFNVLIPLMNVKSLPTGSTDWYLILLTSSFQHYSNCRVMQVCLMIKAKKIVSSSHLGFIILFQSYPMAASLNYWLDFFLLKQHNVIIWVAGESNTTTN